MSYTYTGRTIDTLTINGGTEGTIDVTVYDGGDPASIDVPAEDAPAVALAILEAAGIDGRQPSHAHHAVRALMDHQAVLKDELDREAENAKVRAWSRVVYPGSVTCLDGAPISDKVRDRYRRSREFFKEEA